MVGTELTLELKSGLWIDERGRRFVRNEFDPSAPVLIDITTDEWYCSYQGRYHTLRWNRIKLPEPVKLAFRQVSQIRLRTSAPSSLTKLNSDLRGISAALLAVDPDSSWDLDTVAADRWALVWKLLRPGSRTTLRTLYAACARLGLTGARKDFAAELKLWKARHDLNHLRDVLQWCPKYGALTSSEQEILRSAYKTVPRNEPVLDRIARLFTRTCHETLKRPEQLLSIGAGGVVSLRSKSGGEPEYFLKIPPSKAQTGRPDRLEPVSSELGAELDAMLTDPRLARFQRKYDRLFVVPPSRDKERRWQQHGQVPTELMGSIIHTWAVKLGLTSPRTKRTLSVKPRRLRHTGATSMALQGVPRDQIQDALEHDSPLSANAYIRAVGSELLPAIERASERGLGAIFDDITSQFFFKGALTDSVDRRPIFIPENPEFMAPAVVGRCSSGSTCHKHPFWACYNGCPHFLAWRSADHAKALAYVERELARWSAAEGGRERSKLFKDFERMAASIREVMAAAALTQVVSA